jgi:hypothetical protein
MMTMNILTDGGYMYYCHVNRNLKNGEESGEISKKLNERNKTMVAELTASFSTQKV